MKICLLPGDGIGPEIMDEALRDIRAIDNDCTMEEAMIGGGAEEVLNAMLPRYVTARVWTCLLGAAASELAARQRAMKSATDNAENLIKNYTRLANQARQAEITQEISEIVGGASALAESK